MGRQITIHHSFSLDYSRVEIVVATPTRPNPEAACEGVVSYVEQAVTMGVGWGGRCREISSPEGGKMLIVSDFYKEKSNRLLKTV